MFVPRVLRSSDEGGSSPPATPPADADAKLRAMVEDHSGRGIKRLRKELLDEQRKGFEEIKALLAGGTKPEPAKTEAPTDPAAPPKTEGAVSPEVAALKAEIAKNKADFDKALRDRDKRAEAAEAKAKAVKLRASFAEAAAARFGADNPFLKEAIPAILMPHVGEDEQGQPFLKFPRRAEDGSVEDEIVPLADGLDRWAKEHPHYIPARPTHLPSPNMGWIPGSQRAGDGGQPSAPPSQPWLNSIAKNASERYPAAAAHLAAVANAPPPKQPPK